MKTMVLIDGNATHVAAKANQFEVDWRKIANHFLGHVSLNYYTTIWTEKDDDTDEQDFIPLKPVLDYLAYNGYVVTTKMVKEQFGPAKGWSISIIPDMIVDMMERGPYFERVMLFGSSPDLTRAATFLQRKGVFVGVFSTVTNNLCSDNLRRQVDAFYDLKDYITAFRKLSRDAKIDAN